MQQNSHGGGGDSYYDPLQPPPRKSSLKSGQSAYIYPSRRTSKHWGIPTSAPSTERASTPAIQIPQYILLNPPPPRNQTKRKQQGKSGVVYYPVTVAGDTSTLTPPTPREWETDPETDGSWKTTSSGNRRSSARVLSSTSKPTSTYKPPRRTFAEYIWQYAQRLRKKGKRVRFVPQPTEIPAAEGLSRRGKSREGRYPQPEGGRGHTSTSATMGSSLSKPIIGSSSRSRRRNSRDQQQYVITDPYATSQRRGHTGAGEASSSSHRGQGAYTYTYTCPQYPLQSQYTPNQYGYQYPPTYSTYEPAPESAYYLGTETFPALHSLGTTQVKPSGKTRSRGRLPPEYATGIYNTNAEYYAPPPAAVYRHQHRGTTMGGGGYYISSENSRGEKKREREESIARGGGSGSRSGRGREKKLRRAKGVDDIRGRSLRGGYQRDEGHAYGGGWVAVTA